MIKISQLKIRYEKRNKELSAEDERFLLKEEVAEQLHCAMESVDEVIILKKSIDARKKPDIFYVYALAVILKQSENGKETR